jgi:hypothetical protein
MMTQLTYTAKLPEFDKNLTGFGRYRTQLDG